MVTLAVYLQGIIRHSLTKRLAVLPFERDFQETRRLMTTNCYISFYTSSLIRFMSEIIIISTSSSILIFIIISCMTVCGFETSRASCRYTTISVESFHMNNIPQFHHFFPVKTHHATHIVRNHPNSFRILLMRCNFLSGSFFLRNAALCNRFQIRCFPHHCNFNLFKSMVKSYPPPISR